MALHDIPVLPEEHPLFDWEDHPDAHAALVSGGEAGGFTKEAWNAIVDAVYDALIAAGESWDSKHTSYAGARITESYGELSAAMFNSIRHNIGEPAPLAWAWAVRKDFRGYVGREDFRGFYEHGADGDDVYPEYILELARRANLLIGLMRGTAPTAQAEYRKLLSTLYQAPVVARKSAPVEMQTLSATRYNAPVLARRIAPVTACLTSGTRFTAPAETRKRALAAARVKVNSKCRAAVQTGNAAVVEPPATLMHSACTALVEALRTLETSASVLSGSLHHAEAGAVRPIPAKARVQSCSCHSAQIEKARPLEAGARVLSASAQKVEMDMVRPVELSAARLSGTHFSVEIGSGWLPPKWVDGGLWIRQAHTVNQLEDGSLEVL